MSTFVDTTVWSLALRRKQKDLGELERQLSFELADMIKRGHALLIGPIRQEILSGIKDEGEFEKLRRHLGYFEDIPLLRIDHEQAARFYNTLKSKGVAAASIDLMICAVAFRLNLRIFTTDPDFDNYARWLPVKLHAPRRLK